MLLSGMRGKNYGVEHLLAPFSGDLDHILDATLGLKTERVDFLLTIGALYLGNKRIHDRNIQIENQAYLRVHTHPRRFPAEIFDFKKSLIEETEDYVVINKPSGLPVHPTVDNQIENIASLIAKELNHEIHVTHRLDVGTSGLLILAKNKKFQSELNQIFMQSSRQLLEPGSSTKHKIFTTESVTLNANTDQKRESDFLFEKKYRALVYNTPALQELLLSGNELVHFMEPSPRAPKKVSREKNTDWQTCRLKILSARKIEKIVLANDTDKQNCELVELEIELLTGRTHQIRVQLADLGSPVVGDEMYGNPNLQVRSLIKTSIESELVNIDSVNIESFCLQSQSLSWHHPKYGFKKFSLIDSPWNHPTGL